MFGEVYIPLKLMKKQNKHNRRVIPVDEMDHKLVAAICCIMLICTVTQISAAPRSHKKSPGFHGGANPNPDPNPGPIPPYYRVPKPPPTYENSEASETLFHHKP
ncbi:hypothetical protein M8C21_018504 [Ambrosia artemisiifolia]|uniref:Uncharacterized protein n=1 Tax=Ambrosia artemisiifolia TaxID=4212 RepID=A0AAD5GUW0_AMBAR|nr:hypothetical protein M8C21_018504 [Ambrosia artemisiifolia]